VCTDIANDIEPAQYKWYPHDNNQWLLGKTYGKYRGYNAGTPMM
jgi:hypothetical protein